jgi:hypothetical protein
MNDVEDGTLCNSAYPPAVQAIVKCRSLILYAPSRDTADGQHYFSLCVYLLKLH